MDFVLTQSFFDFAVDCGPSTVDRLAITSHVGNIFYIMTSSPRYYIAVMRSFCLFVLSLMLLSCAHEPYTRVFHSGKRLSNLKNKKLKEISGLVASRANPGYLWVHNDGGNPAEVYLVDLALNVRLTCTFPEAENRDWEDIAIGAGPDPDKTYLYIGDIGDNQERKSFKTVFRFEEPRVNGLEALVIRPEERAVNTDRITFRLEDGSKDMEAMIIDPSSKDILLISKRENPAYVYNLVVPEHIQDTLVAKRTAQLNIPGITAADVSPDGKELLVKRYNRIYYWRTDSVKPLAQWITQMPIPVRYKRELQGEALGWDVEGNGFYTLSEKPLAIRTPLFYHRKRMLNQKREEIMVASPQ